MTKSKDEKTKNPQTTPPADVGVPVKLDPLYPLPTPDDEKKDNKSKKPETPKKPPHQANTSQAAPSGDDFTEKLLSILKKFSQNHTIGLKSVLKSPFTLLKGAFNVGQKIGEMTDDIPKKFSDLKDSTNQKFNELAKKAPPLTPPAAPKPGIPEQLAASQAKAQVKHTKAHNKGLEDDHPSQSTNPQNSI